MDADALGRQIEPRVLHLLHRAFVSRVERRHVAVTTALASRRNGNGNRRDRNRVGLEVFDLRSLLVPERQE